MTGCAGSLNLDACVDGSTAFLRLFSTRVGARYSDILVKALPRRPCPPLSTGVSGGTSSQDSRLGERSGASDSILSRALIVSSRRRGSSEMLFLIKKLRRRCRRRRGSRKVLIVMRVGVLPTPPSFMCRKRKSHSRPGAAVASSIEAKETVEVRTRPR